MHLRRWLKRHLPIALRGPIRYGHVRGSIVLHSLSERLFPPPSVGLPLPPPGLRYRVGSIARQDFLDIGRNCARDLKNHIQSLGKEIGSFDRVLDFGCGSGRVLRHLCDLPETCRLYGSDIDPEAIAWCRSHLLRGHFAVNGPVPPLAFASESFDLIYALSVFTHLNEDYQRAWLAELARVAKPGGVVMLTTNGTYTQGLNFQEGLLSSKEMQDLRSNGFLFKVVETGRLKSDGLPDFYQIAFHTSDYVTRVWANYFTVRHYAERGMDGYQDLVVLSK